MCVCEGGENSVLCGGFCAVLGGGSVLCELCTGTEGVGKRSALWRKLLCWGDGVCVESFAMG